MNFSQALVSLIFGFLGALLFSLVHKPAPLPRTAVNQAAAHTDPFPTATNSSAVLSASAIRLVDQKGRIRAQFAFSQEGTPGFWMFDDNGVARLTFGLYQDNTSYFGLQDAQGQMTELMRSFGPKQTPLLIFKTQGQDMMITGLNPSNDPTPFLMYYGESRVKKVHFGQYDGP